eukprot:scaffold493_cov74-Cyclotella_meneghiniana.AAC.3
MSSHKVGIPATMQAKIEGLAAASENPQPAAAKPSAPAATSRPVHPAVFSTFGPGKGGGCSEFSVWAYLTRPRPPASVDSDGDAPLPNLVTAHSNALRVYTVLPHGGTLALTAVYDNLAGTICSLDVIPHGTGGGDNNNNMSTSSEMRSSVDDYLDDEFDGGGDCSYDGLLIGFAGHPRLSLVYPSTPMVGGGYWNSSKDTEASNSDDVADVTTKNAADEHSPNEKGFNYGVGQGGVLLASSIIDLTPALMEKSMGGTSFLEQDMIVSVSTSSTIANGVDVKFNKGYNDDPSVSVVLGGGVAIASFSLPKSHRPGEGGLASPSWWRVASEPYVLPLAHLASKIRSDFGGSNLSAAGAPVVKGKNQPNVVGHTGSVGHGFGDVLDISFLSGYTEPTLLILHSNPKRGGGRQWVGRMGRTEEIPVVSSAVEKNLGDDEMDIDETKAPPETTATGTKYALTLTAVSLAIHQHRSVVLWSLTDAIPADAWKLIPHPRNGVVVLGVNTIVYVSMGGKITSALAVNGFAKISCPVGLIPPSKTSSMSRNLNSVHLEANPSPLPLLALQLDGARVGFVSENVAIVCLGNGSLLSLQLHSGATRIFMSLSPMGHRVGGLGVSSCLSILSKEFHTLSVDRYLKNNSTNSSKIGTTKTEDVATDSKDQLSGPNIAAKGMFFVGSRMGDCTLLAFEMNEPTCLIVTDVEDGSGTKRKLDSLNSDNSNSTPEPTQKQLKLEEVDTLENEGNKKTLTKEDILRLEEEELYRDDSVIVDTTAPNLVSPSRTDIDVSNENDGNDVTTSPDERKTVQSLTTFRTITALDSLTGLGPLGQGCYGPVATFPHSTGQDEALPVLSSQSSLFSNTFASSARHMIMPCGFGDSGGLAVLTTPGRDTIGGTILCEADLLGMEGTIFSLPQSNLILMGKSDSAGAMILRGVVRSTNGHGSQPIEEFEEVDAKELSQNLAGEGGSSAHSLHNVEDIMKMQLYAVSEFGRGNSLFLVKTSQGENGIPYSIIIMRSNCHAESKDEISSDIKLSVAHEHRITFNALLDEGSPRSLSSVTPIVSDNVLSISFGCVWSCGHASVFHVKVTDEDEFEVFESIFLGDTQEDTEFYRSNKIVAMDLVALPGHIFIRDDTETSVAVPDESTTLSFPPDRISMHGSWISRLDGSSSESTNKTVIVLCRRSGSLEMYNKDDAMNCSQLIKNPSNTNTDIVPIWKTEGCGHGVPVLGHIPNKTRSRKPEGLVETAEIRVFVSGPSLSEELIDTATAKDAWMLRSLCVLVDTSLGDLQLYSGSKRKSNGSRLEFSRVPLNCVTRPSEEAGRHFVKLRRKGIVPDAVKSDFRSNRLHRFSNISLQSGLFAATPRPLWFVSERGAPAVVSHKSRHVSAAGARQVSVSGFCSEMPCVFTSARTGFISLHERIGRVGSQRLTLFNGLLDVFSPRGLLPGGGVCIHKYPLGVTVRQIEFIDDASISSPSRPIYAMLISREVETKQTELNDDGMTPEERQQIKAEKEAARIRKQVEADLGGFDIEQEWVEEIEREECFEVDKRLGLAPSIPAHKFEVWLVDAATEWAILDKYELDDLEHGTALKVLYLTDVIEDSDEIPQKYLFIAVGTGIIEYDGEDFASKGKLMLFQAKKAKSKAGKTSPFELVKRSEKEITIGPVTYLASLHSDDIYRVVVGAGAEVTVEQWGSKKLSQNVNERQLSQVGFYHAHMQVLQLTIFKTFFLLSDGYDSMHFLVWRESDKSLTLLAKDFEPCEVFAGGLISRGGKTEMKTFVFRAF